MEKIYSVKEVCNYLKVGAPTVYELIAQNQLIARKVGKAYKITETALTKYVTSLSENVQVSN
ncbi:MAG: helix-turn-helix domain-containing protein [Bacillota bacterium]|nr:helix-turn-helix domain-containing protein [Bacillota bacterium]